MARPCCWPRPSRRGNRSSQSRWPCPIPIIGSCLSIPYQASVMNTGLGFVYVAPPHRAGRPLEFNWIAREDSEDFAGLVNYRDVFQPGARRFDVGERSNFALLPMAMVALRQILDWRVEEVAATLGELTAHIEREG